MINKEYWEPQFTDAIKQNNLLIIKYLLASDCQIGSYIFSAIIQLPGLDSEILCLAIKAMHTFESYHLQQIISLFPKNDKAIIESINATKNIQGHLIDVLSKMDIDIALAKTILTKLSSTDQSKLSKILQLAQNDQELINIGISKINTLLPHNLQEIFAIQNITAKNLELAIIKAQEIQEWNLKDLLALKPSPEILTHTINKMAKLSGYHLEQLLAQGYDQLNILKLCISKIDKLEEGNLKEFLALKPSPEIVTDTINKMAKLSGWYLQQLLAQGYDQFNILKLCINKIDKLEEWNLTELVALKPSPEIVTDTINKIEKLSSWHLQQLLAQGYDQLNILKLCINKIDKLEEWNLKELLQVANPDGQLIRFALDKIKVIDDVVLIKLALDKTDFIRLGHLKLLLNNGIFNDVRELALEKLQTILSLQELEDYIKLHNKSPSKLATEEQVYGAEKHDVHTVHENLSTDATKQWPSAGECLKTIYDQHAAFEPHPDSTVFAAEATES